MKFEVENQNTIKIHLDDNDITKWGTSFEELSCESQKTQRMFFELLENAQKETGFRAFGSRLLIEAAHNKFTTYIKVTKIDDPEDFINIENFADGKLSMAVCAVFYKFSDFENILSLLQIRQFCDNILKSRLYLYQNSYCLKLELLRRHCGQIENIVFENMGEPVESEFTYLLEERGKTLIKSDAIPFLNKEFINKRGRF